MDHVPAGRDGQPFDPGAEPDQPDEQQPVPGVVEPAEPQRRKAVTQFFADHVLSAPGEFRMIATMADGQPAFLAYQHAKDGTYQPHAVHVLTLDTSGVTHIALFREPTVCTLFTRSTDAA